jgi:transcriptional regulator with XRE-family HTH domain
MRDATKAELRAEFGRRLERLLRAKGWTQSELARAAQEFLAPGKKFGRDSISNYIHGVNLPRGPHLDALCKALDCKPEDLVAPPIRSRLILAWQSDGTVAVTFPSDGRKMSFEDAMELSKIISKYGGSN